MPSIEIKHFGGIVVEDDFIDIPENAATNAINIRLDSPNHTISNEVGTQKWNAIGLGGRVMFIHQLKKHGYLALDESTFNNTIFTVENGNIAVNFTAPAATVVPGSYLGTSPSTIIQDVVFSPTDELAYVLTGNSIIRSNLSGTVTKTFPIYTTWDITNPNLLNPINFKYDDISKRFHSMDGSTVFASDRKVFFRFMIGDNKAANFGDPKISGANYLAPIQFGNFNNGVSQTSSIDYDPYSDTLFITTPTSGPPVSASNHVLVRFKMDGSLFDAKQLDVSNVPTGGITSQATFSTKYDDLNGSIKDGSGKVYSEITYVGSSVARNIFVIASPSFSFAPPAARFNDQVNNQIVSGGMTIKPVDTNVSKILSLRHNNSVSPNIMTIHRQFTDSSSPATFVIPNPTGVSTYTIVSNTFNYVKSSNVLVVGIRPFSGNDFVYVIDASAF